MRDRPACSPATVVGTAWLRLAEHLRSLEPLSHVQDARGWPAAEQAGLSQLPRAWRAAAAMFLLNGGLFGIWASRIPSFAERLQISSGQLGLLLLGMAAGGIAAFPVAGRLSDRHGAGVIARPVAVLYVLALCLVGVAPSVKALAICVVLFGAMQGALDIAMNAWGVEVERQLGQPTMSLLHAMFSLGAGVGALSGSLAAWAGLGPAQHFLWAGLFLGCGSLVVANGPWSSPARTVRSRGGLALPRGPLALVGVVAACASLSEGALADWSSVFLYSVSHLSEAQSALGYAAFSAAMVAMRLIGDRIVGRWGPGWSARIGGGVAALGVLLVVLGHDAFIILAGFALMGVGLANIAPLAFSRAGSDPAVPAGAAIAGVATFGYGGLLLGPSLIGWLSGVTSLVFGFSILAALAVLISLLGSALEAPRSSGKRLQ